MSEDFLKLQIGLTEGQFCDLLEATIRKLVEVLEKPAAYDPVRVDMARGAIKILTDGPHFIPREVKMGYADDLVHLLVAREALFPGDVRRGTFDGLIVGIPDPPRKKLMDLSTTISEGAPGKTDGQLIEAARSEMEKIAWRHPGRLAFHQRMWGLASLGALAFIVYQLDLQLHARGLFDLKGLKILGALQLFFTLAANTVISLVLLRPRKSPWGPGLVDMSEEHSSQLVFIVNGALQHAADIYPKAPGLALAGTLIGCAGSVLLMLHGQQLAFKTVEVATAWFWAFWTWIH